MTSEPTVLVAAPTARMKDYALERWVDAYHAFTYAPRGVFMVDNTPATMEYVHRIRKFGIPAAHIEPVPGCTNFIFTLERCWPLIVRRAVEWGYDYVASIESDVICPPETLDVLLANIADNNVCGISYPLRHTWQAARDCHLLMALGCTLIRTDWLSSTIDLWFDSPEQDIWRTTKRLELDAVLPILHLDDGE